MPKEERRKHPRLKRSFIVSYRVSDEPDETFDVTQIKDISLGGMRFVTAKGLLSGTILNIKLKTPFNQQEIELKAKVIESNETVQNLIYDTRVCFIELEEEKRESLAKIIETFLNLNIGEEPNEN